MESRPVSLADVAAGEEDFGDEAVPLGEDPAGDDRDEGLGGGGGEDRGELREQVDERRGKFQGSVSLSWWLVEARQPRQGAKKPQGNRRIFLFSCPPSKVRNSNLEAVEKPRHFRKLKGDHVFDQIVQGYT
jgi:hypothetical protein